jgi:hypothetical protein
MDAKKITYRVQVPAARGRVIPEMDSMREDFPALVVVVGWIGITGLSKLNLI